MRITEAVELLNQIGADVDFALDYLQERQFQLALYIGGQLIFDEVPIFKSAVGLLIERGRTDLLEQRCRKIYEAACVAEPLLKQAIPNCKKIGMMIGEAEAKGNIWASHIKAYWEKVVLPTLQTNSQAQGETTPQKQGDEPQQVPSWATTDVAKRAFAKAVKLDYMSPLEYGYKWKLKSTCLFPTLPKIQGLQRWGVQFPWSVMLTPRRCFLFGKNAPSFQELPSPLPPTARERRVLTPNIWCRSRRLCASVRLLVGGITCTPHKKP